MARTRRLLRDPRVGPPDTGASGPVRTCIGCRRRGAPDTLVRLDVSDEPPGYLIGRSLPGRGAWLCLGDAPLLPSDACLAEAMRRKSFARAFRATSTSRN